VALLQPGHYQLSSAECLTACLNANGCHFEQKLQQNWIIMRMQFSHTGHFQIFW